MTTALSDLVRYLNTRTDQLAPDTRLKHPFLPTETGALVHFAGLRLQSRYLPIVDTRSGQLHGHAANLLAEGQRSGKPLDPASVFVLPTDNDEFVYLDRLLRTLHALNYLTEKVRGNLLLKVHQRHVMTVPADHGLAFEELLRPVGLIPAQVTLEIDPTGVADNPRFLSALQGYQSRGYGIALTRFGGSPRDFSLIAAIRPDIVKLDPLLLDCTRTLASTVDRLHASGTSILVEGIGTGPLRFAAREHGIDLLQSPAVFLGFTAPPATPSDDQLAHTLTDSLAI